MRTATATFVSALMLFWVCLAEAQLTTGTISGSATDPSGAMVPGANVTVKNLETGISRSTVTGGSGRYEVPNLPVGNYEVSAEMNGFKKTIRSGIELTVGRTAVVDMALQVGEVTQAVTVTDEVSLVETASATVSSLVDEKKVADLPLNNRDLTQLVFLQPGVLQVPREQGNIGYRSGMGATFSVGGARGNQNTFLLDGMSNSDPSGNAAGAAQSYIGAETVKEFQIIINNYSAEYQSLPGAIVSAVTKSGTNTLHGSIFEYARNDNFDATKWDNKIVPLAAGQKSVKNEFKRNQFGGAIGGPIVRDHTFYFASYEGLRERQAASDTAFVPTVAARQGILPITTSLTAANCTASSGVVDLANAVCALPVAASVRAHLALWPVPGVGNTMGNSDNGRVEIFGVQRAPVNDDYVNGKIDHQFAGQRAGFISGTFSFDDANRDILRMLGDLANRGTLSRKYVLAFKHTSVLTPATINEFGFGFNRTNIIGEIPLDGDSDIAGLAFLPGAKRLGQLSVGNIASLGYSNSEAPTLERTISLKDGLSLSRGNHSFRTGVELQLIRDEDNSCPPGCYGNYNFQDLRRFITGVVRRYDALLPTAAGFPGFKMKQSLFGAYFQDDYRIMNSLTLNLGMRYEFVTIPKEVNGNLRIMKRFEDPALVPGPFFASNPTTKSFSPRFGFAYAPGSRKTSIRGGAGIFYDHPMLYETRTNLGEMPPFRSVGQVSIDNPGTPAIPFPNGYGAITSPNVTLTTNLRTAQWNIDTTYIYRWNLTLQREVMGDWLVSAGYTGSRAVHLWNQYVPNLNKWLGWPNQPTGAKYFPATNEAGFGGRIQPNFAQIRWQASNGSSYHHGLALSGQRRLRNGLQFQISYNFAKTIDQGTDVTGGELGTNQRTLYMWDTHLLKALSSQDVRHAFTANYSYELPLARGRTGIAGAIAKGWQLNGIITLTSGYPLTIVDSNSAQLTRMAENGGLAVNMIPNGDSNPTVGTTAGCGTGTSAVTGGQTLGAAHRSGGILYYDPCQFEASTLGYYGTLGRNTLITPGLASTDFSLFKNFDLSEGRRFQFRAELFNVLNRVNLSIPDTTPLDANGIRDSAAGRINATRGSARQIQFALKYIF